MVDSSNWMYDTAAAAAYTVTNSARFWETAEYGAGYLTFTQGTPTNAKVWTFSAWFKLTSGIITTNEDGAYFLGAQSEKNGRYGFSDSSGNKNLHVNHASGADGPSLNTAHLFRDTTSWFHLVIAYDSSDATAADRQKIYINGVLQDNNTNGVTTVQDLELDINKSGKILVIGGWRSDNGGGSESYWGYMSEVYFIDGTQYDADEFGETDSSSGIWIPKDADVTYGNNGIRLEFKESGTGADSSGIGADTSGNTNHMTVAGSLAGGGESARTRVCTDTPTNNWCTLNNLDRPATFPTFSEGNLRVVGSGEPHSATFHISSGKWYYEWKIHAYGTGSGTIAWCGLLSYKYPTQVYGSNGAMGLWGYKDPVATAGDPITMGFRIYPQAHYVFKNSNDGNSGNSMTAGQDFTMQSGCVVRVCIDYDNGAYYLGVWEGVPSGNNGAYIGGDGTENDGHGWLNHGATAGQTNPATGAYPSIGVGSAGTTQGRSTQDGTESDVSLLTTVPGPVRIFQVIAADSQSVKVNYGQPSYTWSGSSYADANGYGIFQYEPPSGYYALCSQNLAEFG